MSDNDGHQPGKHGKQGRKPDAVEVPLTIPNWLHDVVVATGNGGVRRLGAMPTSGPGLSGPVAQSAALRLTLTKAIENLDVLVLYPPLDPDIEPDADRRRMPFEASHLRVAYTGGDGGQAAMALCHQVGTALEPHGPTVLAMLFETASAAVAEAESKPAPGPSATSKRPSPERRMTIPQWLFDAVAPLTPIARLVGGRGGLNLMLEDPNHDDGRTFMVRVVRPNSVAFKLAWTSESFGLGYSGHDGIHRDFCGNLGRVMKPHAPALEALLDRAAQFDKAPWSMPEVSQALQGAADWVSNPDSQGSWGTMAPISPSTLAAAGPLDVDALTMAACAYGDPGYVLALGGAQQVGPLTQVLALWLQGEASRAIGGLDQLVAAASDDVVSLRALSHLARKMGAYDRAQRWGQRWADATRGDERGFALLTVAECAWEAGSEADSEAALTMAAPLLSRVTSHLQALAQTARFVGRPDVAYGALDTAAERDDDPSLQVQLAEMALFDLALERATALARRGESHPDAAVRARSNVVIGACELLSGRFEAAQARFILADAHPEPETLWAWRCERAIGLGDWAAARIANEQAQGSRHTLANAIVACRMQAEIAIAEGLGSEPWEMGVHDRDGVLFGRVDPWFGAQRCAEARRSVASARTLLEEMMVAMGGNRTLFLSRRNGGRLVHVPDPGSPRTQSSRLLFGLLDLGAEEARKGLETVVERFVGATSPPCFLGELALWAGDYGTAEAAFLEAHERGGTRWAWIGQGAVRHMLGRPDEALERFETCVRETGFLEGATLVGYRGEMKRIAGDREGGRADLETAVRTRPGRVGAWTNLALMALSDGDINRAEHAFEEIYRRVPALVRLALSETGQSSNLSLGQRPAVTSLGPALEWMLDAMLGNRSSAIWTHRDPQGRFRTLPNPGPLVAWARAYLVLAERLGMAAS